MGEWPTTYICTVYMQWLNIVTHCHILVLCFSFPENGRRQSRALRGSPSIASCVTDMHSIISILISRMFTNIVHPNIPLEYIHIQCQMCTYIQYILLAKQLP